jgi:hypothetical protein
VRATADWSGTGADLGFAILDLGSGGRLRKEVRGESGLRRELRGESRKEKAELGLRPWVAVLAGFVAPVFLDGLGLFGPPNSGASYRGLELVGDPGVQALAGQARGRVDLAVQLRRDASHEVAGKGLVGFFAALGAECQIILHRISEGLLELRDGVTLESNHVARIDDFTMKDAGDVIEFHLSDVTFVLHHGGFAER